MKRWGKERRNGREKKGKKKSGKKMSLLFTRSQVLRTVGRNLGGFVLDS